MHPMDKAYPETRRKRLHQTDLWETQRLRNSDPRSVGLRTAILQRIAIKTLARTPPRNSNNGRTTPYVTSIFPFLSLVREPEVLLRRHDQLGGESRYGGYLRQYAPRERYRFCEIRRSETLSPICPSVAISRQYGRQGTPRRQRRPVYYGSHR